MYGESCKAGPVWMTLYKLVAKGIKFSSYVQQQQCVFHQHHLQAQQDNFMQRALITTTSADCEDRQGPLHTSKVKVYCDLITE
jgi:hypothetical protein